MSDAGVQEPHWAAQKERGSFALMKLTALALRHLGRRPMTPVLYLIVLYFFVFGRRARRNIRQYQTYLANWSGRDELRSTTRRVFGQFMAFGESLLDRLDVWHGRLGPAQVELHDPAGVRDQLRQCLHGGRGQILVCTHLGNLDVCRALAEMGEQVPLNVLVHNRHVAHFNQLQSEAGDRQLRLLQVSEMDAALMLDLSQRLDRGEWLAIAGDRVPLNDGRRVNVDFLGHVAPFPQGPWLMAGLLRCPVNLMCCLKIDGRYQIRLEPFLDLPTWERGRREQTIAQWTQRYADRLAQLCLLAPQQWFNFYAYWPSIHQGETDA
ncbi:glycosyl transferase [Rhodanobacter glycinis]|uniref:Predicted acyltransferase, LPLAT superfamily n=1 Tax=Rhodanobacter glycinis TaxID=582702 RepID=A0A1I4C3G6_9GAMM|nr:glycosyl transferase [Rhodanobacter glycinis]SFK75644.1 Predicted acyltransferase, LPLAT superfamily [Rhodanobacter glycinis]